MQAYMKSAMPFFGIQAPQRRAVCERLFEAHAGQLSALSRREALKNIERG